MTEPSVKLPLDARKRFADEIDLIIKTTRTAPIRAKAIDYAIAKLRKDYPTCFLRDERYERQPFNAIANF